MIFNVYSIRDELSGFMTPVLEANDAIAMRSFRHACDLQPDSSLMSWKPTDYTLFRIATFDSESGVITPISPAELICRGENHEKV